MLGIGAICAKIKDDSLGLLLLVTACGTSAVHIVVTGSIESFGCDVSALGTYIFNETGHGAGCFLLGLGKVVLTNGVLNNPTILDLRITAE